jgi:hypothetical protein
VEVKAGAWHGCLKPRGFGSAIEQLHRDLVGSATLGTCEPDLELALTGERRSFGQEQFVVRVDDRPTDLPAISAALRVVEAS